MHEVLRVDSSYATAMTKKSPSGIVKIWPSLYFYSHFVGIVIKASRLAKAGRYDGEEWTQSSFEVLQLLERIGLQIEIRGLAEAPNGGGLEEAAEEELFHDRCADADEQREHEEPRAAGHVLQLLRRVAQLVDVLVVDH